MITKIITYFSVYVQTRKSSSSSAGGEVRMFFPNVSVLDVGSNELHFLSANIALHVHLSELKLQHNTNLTEVCLRERMRERERQRDKKRKRGKKGEGVDVFPNVSVLDVGSYELHFLSANIALHVHLSELKLQDNMFSPYLTSHKILFFLCVQLPAELGLLRKLWNLNITGCAVRNHLQALLGKEATRTVAVLGYLKSIKEE